MKIKHIIWDYNGTLLNDLELCVNVINNLLKVRNIPQITIESYKALFEFPVKNYYEKLGFDFDKDSFETVGTEFILGYDNRINEARLKSGAENLLKKIHKAGIKQSVLSARKHDQLIKELDNFRIKQYFTHIVGLDNHYANGKTGNGIKLIAKIAEEKENIIMIGDTVHDCEVAKAMGIKSLLLSDGHHTAKKLNKCNSQNFRNIQQLERFIFDDI